MTHTVSIDVAAPVQLYNTFHAALIEHTGGRVDGLLAGGSAPPPLARCHRALAERLGTSKRVRTKKFHWS